MFAYGRGKLYKETIISKIKKRREADLAAAITTIQSSKVKRNQPAQGQKQNTAV